MGKDSSPVSIHVFEALSCGWPTRGPVLLRALASKVVSSGHVAAGSGQTQLVMRAVGVVAESAVQGGLAEWIWKKFDSLRH